VLCDRDRYFNDPHYDYFEPVEGVVNPNRYNGKTRFDKIYQENKKKNEASTEETKEETKEVSQENTGYVYDPINDIIIHSGNPYDPESDYSIETELYGYYISKEKKGSEIIEWFMPGEETRLVEEIIDIVNEERAKEGKEALVYDGKLRSCAGIRAEEIRESFSHTRPDGRDCFTVLTERDYYVSAAGENIAMGQTTAKQVMEDWMNSEGHRENILSDMFTKIGVGVAIKNGNFYFVQLFAK